MAETAAPRWRPALTRFGRWLGFAALAASIAFLGDRLWRLDWAMLGPHASWQLGGILAAAALLFAAADRALAEAWRVVVDPDGRQSGKAMQRIYARGVLMKYLPGSIFQYVSRQFEGAKSGIEHRLLARSILVEIGLHLVGSLSVAAICLLFDRQPLLALGAAGSAAVTLIATRRAMSKALALQILSFSAFALAAILVGAIVLPADASLSRFAALFLFAWLAGFVVPVAPGGIGVREAALLVLADASLPAADLMAATLTLRASSITGDLVFGILTLKTRNRLPSITSAGGH